MIELQKTDFPGDWKQKLKIHFKLHICHKLPHISHTNGLASEESREGVTSPSPNTFHSKHFNWLGIIFEFNYTEIKLKYIETTEL